MRSTTLHVEQGFNGAAAERQRKGSVASARALDRRGLQWGRCRKAAEGGDASLADVEYRASMGPLPKGSGRRCASDAVSRRRLGASMGPLPKGSGRR